MSTQRRGRHANFFVRSLLAALCIGLSAAPACVQAAGLDDKVVFDIPAQPLDAALLRFSQQASVQLLTSSDELPSGPSNAVSGLLPVRVALGTLLEGTGLTFSVVKDGTIAIRRSDSSSASGAAARPAPAMHIAQADTSPAEDQPMARAELDEVTVAIPEVLVVGSRSINADIRRTEDDPQPYVVFDREQIARSMSSSLDEFLRSRLPMNTIQQASGQLFGGASLNTSRIDLRGLGQNQTLILVDGRRMPGVSSGGESLQPDINGIPMSAIERIEVLASTASGIYGGGATGGVVNIITRKDYSGIEVQATYGNTFDSAAANRRLDASAGFSLEDGRTRILLAGSRADSDALRVGERDFASRARELQFDSNASAFLTGSPPIGATPNIVSQNGTNLVLDNGTPLGSPRTFIPAGYAGPASDGGAALVSNAGLYDLGLYADAEQLSLVNNPKTESLSLFLQRAFGSHVDAFADASWLGNYGHTYSASPPTIVTLAAAAPNNPFTTAVNVRFPSPGVPSQGGTTNSETLRAIAGLIARLPHEWTISAEYAWSRSRLFGKIASPQMGDPDGTGGSGLSVDRALQVGALDVMRDVNVFPLDYSPYLLPSPNLVTGPADTVLTGGTVRLSGPLVRLPSGPMTLAAMIERREEDAKDDLRQRIDSNGTPSAVLIPARSQTVDSYYLEAAVPIVSAAKNLPAVRKLDLQASVRHDEYVTRSPRPSSVVGPGREGPFPEFSYPENNEVQATRYTLGLLYSPVDDVAVRASYGTGFLPPAVNQTVATLPAPSFSGIADPKRGGTVGPAYIDITGGNPNLEPEDSESFSAGVIFTPRFLPGLRLSLDYTRVAKTNEIASLTALQILDLEDSLTGRVTRAALSPEDALLGYTGGIITQIDRTRLNISAARLEAWDAQLDYVLPTDGYGEFRFYAIVTRQPAFARKTVVASPFVDSVGFNGGPLEWRGNAGLTWERGPWALDWSTQYYDSYLVYAATATAATIASATLNQGSALIPDQTYHDITARYRFGDSTAVLGGVLDDVEITFGVQNVFDESPPILASTAVSAGYSFFGDPRLRRYSISVRKSF